MTLEYTESSNQARAILLREYNDVDIFIEDAVSKFAVEKLIRKSLPTYIRFESAIALGSRNRVVEAAEFSDDSRVQCYIVDGDREIFFSRKPEKHNLIQLSKYSIENYYFTEENLIELALSLNPRLNNIDAKRLLDFGEIESILDSLIGIYAIYSINMDSEAGDQTINFNVYHLINFGGGLPFTLRSDKIRTRMVELGRNATTVKGHEWLFGKIDEVRPAIQNRSKRASTLLPGRNVCFKVGLAKIKRFVKAPLTDEVLISLCARLCEPCAEQEITDFFKSKLGL